MRPIAFTIVIGLLLASAPTASALVTFNPIDELPRSLFGSEKLAEALKSQNWSHGLEFWGWGQHSITLYYEGDARDFRSFVSALQAAETAATIKSSVVPQRLIRDQDLPRPREPRLFLAPGRGKHIGNRFGLEEDFAYDWGVHITHTFDDELNSLYTTTISDRQGRTVRRRIAKRPEFAPRISMGITWYVGDGAALSEIELPSDWLIGQESTIVP